MDMIDKKYLLNVIQKMNLKDFTDNIIDISRYYNKEYNREYSVFKVTTKNNSLVLKKTKINEINVYKLLKKIGNNFIPSIYSYIEDMNEYWICLEEIFPYNPLTNKEVAIKLVKTLAQLHGSYITIKDPNEVASITKWVKKSTEILDYIEVEKESFKIAKRALQVINNNIYTLIHGDMIPLNVIADKNSIKLIDWENGKIAPYILDLGRLLGDYNIDKPWLDQSWEKDLLTIYYTEFKKIGDVTITYEKFYIDYICEKFINYAEIVVAYKKRKWDIDDWYHLNMNLMINMTNELKKILQ